MEEKLKVIIDADVSKLQDGMSKATDATEKTKSKLELIGKTLSSVGDSVQQFGKKFQAVSDAVSKIAGACMDAFEEVDAGADIAIKATGAIGDQAVAIEEAVKNVGGSVKGSWEDVGATVGEVATRFGLAGDELEGTSSQFMKFADITGQDALSAVQGVDQVMKRWNVDTADTNKVLGLLAKASQDTGISVDELESILQDYAPVMQEMGFGIEETIDLMAQFEREGLDQETTLNGIKKATTYYAKENKSAKEGLEDLIKKLQNSATSAEAQAEAFEIFGDKNAQAFINMAKQGKISFDDLDNYMDDYSNTVDDTYQATLDGTDKMAITWKNLQSSLADLGATIGEVLAPIFEKIIEIIKTVLNKINELPDPIKEVIVIIGLIAVAFAPVVTAIGGVVSAIGTISTALSTAFAPVLAGGIVIAGVLAIKDVLDKIYEEETELTFGDTLKDYKDKTKEIKDNLQTAFDTLKTSIGITEGNYGIADSAIDEIEKLLPEAVKTGDTSVMEKLVAQVEILNEIYPNLNLLIDENTGVINMSVDALRAYNDELKTQLTLEAYKEFYKESYKAMLEAQLNMNGATSEYSAELDAVCQKYDIQRGLAERCAKEVADQGYISHETYTMMQEDLGMSTDAINALENELKNGASPAYLTAKDAMGAYTDATNACAEAEKMLDQEIINTTKNSVQANTDAQNQNIVITRDGLQEQLKLYAEHKSVFGELGSDAGTFFNNGVVEGLEAGEYEAVLTAGSIANDMMNVITEYAPQWEGAFEGYMNMLSEGIATGNQQMIDNATNGINTIIESLAQSHPEIFETGVTLGQGAGEGYSDGLESTENDVKKSSEKIVTAGASPFHNAPLTIEQSGLQSGKAYAKGLEESSDNVTDSAENVQKLVESIMSKYVEVAEQTGTDTGEGLADGLNNTSDDVIQAMNNMSKTIAEMMDTMKSDSSNTMGDMDTNTVKTFTGMVTKLSAQTATLSKTLQGTFETMQKKIGDVFKSMDTGLLDSFKSMVNTTQTYTQRIIAQVQNMVSTLKNSLNFSWNLPYLPLPHIYCSGGFNYKTGAVPSYSISWYRQGAIFDEPTIFNTPFGMKGVGEAGPEVVAPLSDLEGYIAGAIRSTQTTQPIVLNVDGKTFAETSINTINQLTRQRGSLALNII